MEIYYYCIVTLRKHESEGKRDVPDGYSEWPEWHQRPVAVHIGLASAVYLAKSEPLFVLLNQ